MAFLRSISLVLSFSILGGKVIHIDTNVGSLDEVHEVVSENVGKYPNGKW